MAPPERAPRKSLSDPDGDVDAATTVVDVTSLAPPKLNDTSIETMNNIASLRYSFEDIRVEKQQDHADKLADLEERFTQRFEGEQHKRETHVRELLERLERAITKKMACEEAMVQVVASMKQDTEAFQLAISSVYAERLQQCQEGAAMAEQAQAQAQAQAGGIPLMQGEQKVRARVEKLME
ncbi:hypothetical protein PG994_012405 [Apiospora phragmitis]|uniref:Uncharacterized protein n=1 Tax=Apiospora phragmitis TaxID=2905665 RepID=A0ABR1TXU4_9PEZI